MGQQQLVTVGGGVLGGGVAPEAGPGALREGPTAQRLGRPGVPQVTMLRNPSTLQNGWDQSKNVHHFSNLADALIRIQ